MMRAVSTGFLRPPAIRKLRPAGMVDHEITRARKDCARLQAVKSADRVAKMRRIGVADVLRQMREVDVLVGEMQEMTRALPGPERAKGNAGFLLEQMQKA